MAAVSLLTLASTITEALSVANALSPLLQGALQGGQTEVTLDEVRAALQGKDDALARLEKAIAAS